MQPKSLRFSKKDPQFFFQTMRRRVNQYFEENNLEKTGNIRMYFKTLMMFALYFTPYFYILFMNPSSWMVVLIYTFMGLGLSGIGLSIMHDANHGSYSKNKTMNSLLGYSLNIIGGSSFTWKVQHNILHHTYTNIYEMDEDIHDKPFLRLSPYGKYKWYHQFQHYYAILLYSLATVSWILSKDFRQLKEYNQTGMTERSGHQPRKEWLTMLVSKAIYLFYIIGIPILMGATWWAVLLGFLFMHMVAGVLITVIFQLAHVVEGPTHHEPHPTGTMENTWAIHQLQTTANFAHYNPIISWFVGGLNYQIEHHLFPHVCHIHYRNISKIVKETALEFDLPYYENKWFMDAVFSHLRVLREFGKKPEPTSALAA